MSKKLMSYLTVMSFLFLMASCQYSQGVKKNFNTGLTSNFKGLSAENIFLAAGDDSPMQNNEIRLGNKVKIVADGVENFKAVNGRVYPGCSILLLNAANDSLLYIPDAYSDLTDGKAKDEASYLTATLTTGDPMMARETYSLKVKFFDKQDKEKYINAECALKMSE